MFLLRFSNIVLKRATLIFRRSSGIGNLFDNGTESTKFRILIFKSYPENFSQKCRISSIFSEVNWLITLASEIRPLLCTLKSFWPWILGILNCRKYVNQWYLLNTVGGKILIFGKVFSEVNIKHACHNHGHTFFCCSNFDEILYETSRGYHLSAVLEESMDLEHQTPTKNLADWVF